ncbi:MAG: NAD-dependent epimerase/dehydratase family protein [Myxococcales bacterium]|nr:NAD-dependent epimerase/dehydratase family protein [Myxococcales bacterium]
MTTSTPTPTTTHTGPSQGAPATAQPTALILGLTGGYGSAMALELHRRGWQLRALVRDLTRGQTTADRLGLPVDLHEGDVLDPAALAHAAAGVRAIVHGVNAPYHRWEGSIVPMAQGIGEAAVREGATILFPGNVYNFAPGTSIAETTPEAPPTRKGELRCDVEAALETAAGRGAQVIVLRGGDFFGLGHASSWMSHVLAKAARGGALQLPGAPGVRHAWCYLPDFVRAHVDLLERRAVLPAASRFHFAGHVLTRQDLATALRQAMGEPKRRAASIPWGMLRVVGWVMPLMREIVKMRYLWDSEVLLDESKLAATLGTVHQTPISTALARELVAQGITPAAQGADARGAGSPSTLAPAQ